MTRLAVVTLALLATACANQPAVVSESPRQIELRWANNTGDVDQAAQAAQDHCAQYGKRSSFGSMFRDRDVSLETFRCVGPPA